ncbi:MAG TPA: tetratricopeptide repeat protein [Gemmataceae bacterium]|nr:tetratricopeptide repeat protein [Gemmataceae bacterium]
MTTAKLDEAAIFNVARQMAVPEERRLYVQQACAADPVLQARIEAMLRLQDQDPSFLEPPGDDRGAAASPAPDLGAQIGPYTLIRKIGEGGMGTVFLAEQSQPVKRTVAIKIIKPGIDSRRIIGRFEAERQALALMDHPNIARVLDAGAVGGVRDEGIGARDEGIAARDEGGERQDGDAASDSRPAALTPRPSFSSPSFPRPYFVMELVDGIPITKYCDHYRLTPRERLELFIPVCQAVQHAHQKGIIHRDLKPTNVLVARYDEKAVPKIIDFGVAKAVGSGLAERTELTEFGSVIGTLEYMSPEQAEPGQPDIDTRSDIYSLGVLLYELLTGTTPLQPKRLHGAALLELLRIVREEEPPVPSLRLSTTEELPSIAANRRLEPKKLSGLVQGDLDWIVMKALEKDRHRRYETANGFAMDVQRYLADEPVLACPPSPGYRLRKFARRNKGAVVSAFLLTLALLAGIAGTTVGLVQAERRAEGESKAKESAERRLTQIEKGIGILGSIFEDLDPMAEETEGRPLRAILGDRLDQAAAELEGEAVGDALVVARLQDRLGQTYLALGQGERAEALFAKAAMTRQVELGAEDPVTLGSKHNLALAYKAAGKRAEAIQMFKQVHAVRQKVLGADHLDTLTTLNALAVEYRQAGELTEAIPMLEQVRDSRVRQLGESHDHTLATLQQLAGAYLSAGKPTQAIALAEKVWDARVKKHGDDHPKAIEAMSSLAYVYQGGYKMKQAIDLYEQARAKIVPKLGPYHPLTLKILARLGHMYRAYRRTPEAIALLEHVRERQLMVLGGLHPDTLPTLHALAAAYRDAGELNKALPLYQEAMASLDKLKFAHSYAHVLVESFSLCLEQLQQFDQAEIWRRKCLEIAQKKHGTQSVYHAEALRLLGANLLQQKKPAVAEPILREALAILQKEPQETRETLHAQSLLGAALLGQEKYADAEPLLHQAYQAMKEFDMRPQHERKGPPFGQNRVAALERLVKLYDTWGKPEKAAEWRAKLAVEKAKPE